MCRIRECIVKLQRNEKAKYRVEKFLSLRVYFASVVFLVVITYNNQKNNTTEISYNL